MPRVLTMTQKPGETPEQFAARISEQASTFFDTAAQPENKTPDTKPDKASSAPTDESAGATTPEQEPAPSA